jgi:enoyl-CoA hydratase/carnithine racemase
MTTTSEAVRFDRQVGLAIITLANPDANRLNRAVLAALQEALAKLRQPGVRAVLLRGDGPAFSLGADVRDLFVEMPRTQLPDVLRHYIEFIQGIESLPVPTIAAVHGICSSGGLELALAFDELWAAAGTKMGFQEASIGLPPLAAGVQRVAARAGRARAYAIATAGRLFDAELFERWNIVTRIVEVERLHDEALAHARALAGGPTLAYGAVKRMLAKRDDQGVGAADAITVETVASSLASGDARRAITALAQGPQALRGLAFDGA